MYLEHSSIVDQLNAGVSPEEFGFSLPHREYKSIQQLRNENSRVNCYYDHGRYYCLDAIPVVSIIHSKDGTTQWGVCLWNGGQLPVPPLTHAKDQVNPMALLYQLQVDWDQGLIHKEGYVLQPSEDCFPSLPAGVGVLVQYRSDDIVLRIKGGQRFQMNYLFPLDTQPSYLSTVLEQSIQVAKQVISPCG